MYFDHKVSSGMVDEWEQQVTAVMTDMMTPEADGKRCHHGLDCKGAKFTPSETHEFWKGNPPKWDVAKGVYTTHTRMQDVRQSLLSWFGVLESLSGSVTISVHLKTVLAVVSAGVVEGAITA